VVAHRTAIEPPQTGSAARRAEILWLTASAAREISLADQAATSAARRVRVA